MSRQVVKAALRKRLSDLIGVNVRTTDQMADEIARLVDWVAAEQRKVKRAEALLELERARLDWLQTNAEREVRIARDDRQEGRAPVFSIDRWHRRYVSYHTADGHTLREAIDNAIKHMPAALP